MNQFVVSKEIEFDAGHRVPEHEGQCANLHGHRYKVVLKVRGYLQKEGSADGMVLDFSDIKKCLQVIHDKFDHGTMYYIQDPYVAPLFAEGGPLQHMKHYKLHRVPTAENLAAWCFEFAADYFALHKLPGTIIGVEVYETPTSVAYYPA